MNFMNYRDFFKNKKASSKSIISLLPEGVAQSEFKRAIAIENKSLNDLHISATIASRNLKEDANYYKKLYAESIEDGDYAEDAADDSGLDNALADLDSDKESHEEPGNEYDNNGGLPKVGGALAIPHHGQPIMMGKIIQVGGEFKGGQSASGEVSGMTNCGNKDKGGLPVQQTDSKEPITAGGKAVDSSIASKSVGGAVVPGEGQKQGGLNSKGTIASTPKLNEGKEKIRSIVKEVLKEIRFDKGSGKWVRINEEKVNMKMGAAYKTVQPRQYKVMDDDTARTNQFEPEITEMYDNEEETKMNERYVALANAQRNLSEAELTELTTLREKIDDMQVARRNFGLSQGGTEPSLYENDKLKMNMKMGPSYKTVQPTLAKTVNTNTSRENQYDPQVSENEFPGEDKKKVNDLEQKCPECGNTQNINVLSHEENQNQGGSAECPKCGHLWNTTDEHGHPISPNDVSEGRCEDYPCCGHEAGDCPDRDSQGNEVWSCSGCGAKLPKGASSSLCGRCQHKMSELDREDPTGQDSENYFGMDEAGGGAVQHSSYRTADHGNMKQDPEQRWANDIDEAASKVSKAISKGQKGKTSTFSQNLKHQKPKKTSSGVHKRKS